MPSSTVSKKSELEFPWSGAPDAGEVVEVKSGVYWIRMPLPFALDHINLWVLEEDDGWILVDTGIDSPESRKIWQSLFDTHFAGKPPQRLICTHHHPDHMGLSGWLTEQKGIPLHTTKKEWDAFHMWSQLDQPSLIKLMRHFYRMGDVPEQRRESDLKRRESLRSRERLEPASYTPISDGAELRIGNNFWQVCVGTGHAPELAALYSADAGLLISGDQVLPRISPNVSVMPFDIDANPLQDFLDSLEKFRRLPDSVLVLPSHKLPFYGLHARIDELIAHHDARLDDALAACATSVTAADVISVLFPRALNDHQYFFALGETFAHLNCLWHQGALQREIAPEGAIRFVVN